MEKEEYQTLFNIEGQYWWYVGLRQLVFDSMSKFLPSGRPLRLLDAGCGTGGFLSRCDKGSAVGFDFSLEALQFCRENNIARVAQASITEIPFKDNSFDCAVSLDVLCNVKNDTAAIAELFRVLKPKGILILNLPAYESLKSRHDRAVHIDHRYRRSALVRQLQQAGFQIEKATYRNTFLFPLIVIKRFYDKLFFKHEDKPVSDLALLPPWINRTLADVLMLENKILSGLNFFWGVSVFCVARKP